MKKSILKNKSEAENIRAEIEKTRSAIADTEDGEMIPILERLLQEQKYILGELEQPKRTIV